jgi:hypothetical protein
MPVIMSLGIDLIVVTSAIYITRRFFDKRSFVSLGLHLNKQALSDVVLGIVIAFVVMSVVYLIEYSLGWLTFKSYAWRTESPSEVFSQTLRDFVVYAHAGFRTIFGYYILALVLRLMIFNKLEIARGALHHWQ